MFTLRDINSSPFTEVRTANLNFAIPQFITINGQSVLAVTNQTETPIFNGVDFSFSFSGNVDYYQQIEGGRYIPLNINESPLQNIAVGSRITDFLVADFDNDDRDDLIHSFNYSRNLGLEIGDGEIVYSRLNSEGIYQALEPDPFAEVNQNTASKIQAAVDVNGDGWLDLIVQNLDSNSSNIYLNNGGEFSLFTGEVNLPAGIDLDRPELLHTVDEDNDGDGDLVVRQTDGSLSLFRYQNGQYTAVGEAETPFAGIDVGSSEIAFTDADGDTDVDLLAIASDGNISYYENLAIANNNLPIAADDTFDAFNSTPQELDVLFNDFGAQGQPLTIAEFTATSTLGGTIALSDRGTSEPEDDVLVYSAPEGIASLTQDTFTYTVTDVSGQTDTATVTINIFPQLFSLQEEESNPFNNLDVGASSTPTFIDLDGDGDLDLVSGNRGGTIDYFRNDGGNFVQQLGTDNPFAEVELGNYASNSAVDFIDLDNDGDLDLVGGSNSAQNYLEHFYFRNDNGVYTRLTDEENPIQTVNAIGYEIKPVVVDWDGDGLDDLVLGSDSFIRYFHNDGGVLQEVAEVENPFRVFNLAGEGQELDLGQDVSVNFFDFEGDGDLDLLAGNSLGQVLAFQNNEDSWTELSDRNHPFGENIDVGIAATIGRGDIDSDGDEDAIIGNKDGVFFYWQSSTADAVASPNPEPTPEPNSDSESDSLLNASIYRFQDQNGNYLYVGEAERDNISNTYDNWTLEGFAFQVATEPGEGLDALYRLQSTQNQGRYLYVREPELANIRENYSDLYNEEGRAFYVYGVGADRGETVYRLQNELEGDKYLYARSAEKDYILNNDLGYSLEGAAFEVGI